MGLTAEARIVKGLAREREKERETRELFREKEARREMAGVLLKRRCREQTESLNKAGSHQNKVI